MTRHLLLALVPVLGCSGAPDPGPTQPAQAAGPLDLRCLSAPVCWLAARLGAEQVQVSSILPPGEDAPSWRPPAELIAGLRQADLIVANGANYEPWIASATLPTDKLVLTAEGLDLLTWKVTSHSHGGDGEHSHAEVDPHSFASPAMFAQQAAALEAALARALPGQESALAARGQALAAELKALSQGYVAATRGAQGLQLASSHPAFGYLARELGLDIRAFDLDPDAAPGEQQLSELTAWAAGRDPAILLWEAAPSDQARAALPATLQQVVLDPLEQPAAGGYDYLAQARGNVVTLEALTQDPG